MPRSYWVKKTYSDEKIVWQSKIHSAIAIEAQKLKSGFWSCNLTFKGENLMPISPEYTAHNKKEAISILAGMKRRYNEGSNSCNRK